MLTEFEITERLKKIFGAIPTGSRVLGYKVQDSDSDFYVQWQFGAESQLSAMGFEVSHSHSYRDPQVVGVMRHKEAKIDVLLVDNIEARKIIMSNLIRPVWIAKLQGHERQDFWHSIIRIYAEAWAAGAGAKKERD